MSLPTATGMYFDNPWAIPYAETLFLIATEKVDDKGELRWPLFVHFTIDKCTQLNS